MTRLLYFFLYIHYTNSYTLNLVTHITMQLSGKRIAILAEKLYEDLEIWYPYYRLKEEGAEIQVIGSGSAPTYHGKYGYPVTVDAAVTQVKAQDFDAVVIPGGYSPDFMRRHESMIQFVRDVYTHGGVVAAICHGPWMLASADLLRGKTATSFMAIRTDIQNAGANFVDMEVAVDGRIITSRTPDDLPAFCKAIIAAIQKLQ